MPTTILANRYNALRTAVNDVLGVSLLVTPTYGYGQTTSTLAVTGSRASVPNADKVTAQDYENLYIDLIRTRSHQVGATLAIDEFVIGDYNTNTATADKIEESYIQGLESLGNNIITDRFLVDSANLTIEALPSASSTRPETGTWLTEISTIFKIVFPTAEQRRHYFNAGGEIRFSASVGYTGSQPKSVDWQTILNSMGTTSFKGENTVNNAGVGTGSNIGSFDLNTSYQLVYSRNSSAVYANNEYRIYAAESATSDGTSTIIFKVQYIDGTPTDPTYGTDEVVYGRFNSIIETARANSSININGTLHNAVGITTTPTAILTRPLS
jgi:hypothetical protein